jgi:hypothetical protein
MSATEGEKRDRLPVILLIENDEDDAFLFRRALSKLEFQGVVHLVNTVAEACAYLNRETLCRPKLLSLSRPGCIGHEPSGTERQRVFGMAAQQ